MKKSLRLIVVLAVLSIVMLMTSGCFRQDYYMFEDGDFDGVEFTDYDLIHNAELDMDDTMRD